MGDRVGPRRRRLRRLLLITLAVVIGLPLLGGLIATAWISVLDDSSGEVESAGQTREYLLYVPDSYDPSVPTPLVISLHSGALWPAHQRNLSRWNRLADEHGFLVVYPSGTAQFLGVVRVWHTFELGPRTDRDIRFISDLLDVLQAEYNLDPKRIYADGMSNGGGMAYALSCGLSDRIAAVGLVATAQALPPDWCTPARPVPTIAFHGTADPIVPYDGGPLGDPFNPIEPTFPPIETFIDTVAARNGCDGPPAITDAGDGVTRRRYADCTDDAEVIFHSIAGAGHGWPGGKRLPEWWIGPNTDAIDATAESWAFFARHPLR